MAVDFQLFPFTLESIILAESHLTHYSAVDAEGAPYVVTEFYPAYMANRAESGELGILPRFETEYQQHLQEFITRAETMQRINDASVSTVVDIKKENNTAYIIRKANENPLIDQKITDKRFPVEDAYLMIRPMIITLAAAEYSGLTFTINDELIHVNRFGQLMLDGIFSWEPDHLGMVTGLAKLFYRLVQGRVYGTAAPDGKPDAFMPPKLEAMVTGVITGDRRFGSVDDLYKAFKLLIPIRNEDLGDAEKNDKSTFAMKVTIAVLAAVLFFTIIFLFVFNMLIPVLNNSNPMLADTPPGTDAPSVTPGVSAARDFSAFAVTSPQDPENILCGIFCVSEGVEYYRAFDGGYRLAKRDADGNETVLVDGARPYAITVGGGYVYYADYFFRKGIFRVKTEGGQVELLTEQCASYLALSDAYLYYTNHDDRDRMYRLDVNTLETEPFIKTAAYGTVLWEGRVFFLNGGQGFNLYAADLNAEDVAFTRFNEVNGDNLRLSGDLLYFLDIDGGGLQCAAADGQAVRAECPVNILNYNVEGPWIVAVEADTNRLYAYNMDNKELRNLSGRTRIAYAEIADGRVYAVDYEDSAVTHRYTLDTTP